MEIRRVELRIQARERTVITLFNFLNASLEEKISKREAKNRAIVALSAFWKCYALRLSGNDEDIQRQAAIEGINQLLEQAEKVAKDFGIEKHRFLGDYASQSSSSTSENLTSFGEKLPPPSSVSPWSIDMDTLLGDLL